MFGTDSSFLSVFNLDFIEKSSDNPLAGLYSSVISESSAVKLFGTKNAVGKWYKVNESWDFVVTGVFKDLPQNSHINFDLLLTRQTYNFYFSNWSDSLGRVVLRDPDAHKRNPPVTSWNWGYAGTYTYLLLDPKADPFHVEAKINKLGYDYLKDLLKDEGKAEFFLQSVTKIHLDSHLDYEMKANGDRKNVILFALIGLVIMIIAWVNFINLTLVRSLERAGETSVRMIVGASPMQIINQYMLEYGIINISSIILAVIFTMLAKPLFWNILHKNAIISDIRDPCLWLLLVVLFVIGILVTGFYPAYFQSSFRAITMLRGTHKTSNRTVDLRKFLVVLQFITSIILITGVFTIYKQIRFMQTRELGADIDKVLVTYTPMALTDGLQTVSKLQTFKSNISALSSVQSITSASAIPGIEIFWQRQDIRRADDLPNTLKTYAYVYFDHDFLKTFHIKLLSGRNFSDNLASESGNIIINEAAMHQMGYKSADSAANSFVLIGDKQFKIVGIIQNYHQETLKKEIKPIVYFYGYEWYCSIGYYAIKIKSGDLTSAINEIKEIWQQSYPQDEFNYFFLDDHFKAEYKGDRQIGLLIAVFTLLAIVIACLGLYGLTKYSTLKRTKEIGIRKVNGASSAKILFLLTKDYIKLVALSFIVSFPISYYTMHNWLQNYAFRTNLNWWIFLAAGLIALLIALITVSVQAWQVAKRNPIQALRNE
jgi:putative ABC transport system permease protein